MEVEIRDALAPVGVDLGHVHPGDEGAGEGVEETFGGVVDLGYTEDVIDIGDDCQADGGD